MQIVDKGRGNTTELWSTVIHIRVVEAIIFRKAVELIPRGWDIGLRLEGSGMMKLQMHLKAKEMESLSTHGLRISTDLVRFGSVPACGDHRWLYSVATC